MKFADRVVRVILAGLVLGFMYTKILPEPFVSAAIVMAIVLFATGCFGFCPLYKAFHMLLKRK